MFKEDYIEASKIKKPFQLKCVKTLLYESETTDISITYDEYDYLTLERRYGGSWWLLGHKHTEDRDVWNCNQICEIKERFIPELVKWAEYTNKLGHKVSLLNEVRAIDGSLNPIGEFLRIMNKYEEES